MNKKKLQELLKKKEEKRKALVTLADSTTEITELRSINSQIEEINNDIHEYRTSIETMVDEPEEIKTSEPVELENRGKQNPISNFKPLGTYATGTQATHERSEDEGDIYSSIEYRTAFKNYVVNGTPIPEKFNAEKRADALTTVTDVAAIIPTNIMNKIIEEKQSIGRVFPRITQATFQGGLQIPISTIKPTAKWITESVVSDKQKMDISKSIQFSYHLMECKIAIGLVSSTVSLAMFENFFTNSIKNAMMKLMETSIISGTGVGQPKGILKETTPAKRTVSMTAVEIKTIAKWTEIESVLPLAYETNSVYLMAKTTWEKYINGATDTTGQRIGFVSIGSTNERRLNGREVVLTDEIVGFDGAAAGDVFAILVQLDEYIINSNMAMSYKRYYDEDTNSWVHKGLLIADGKMADTNGLIFIKKA